MPNLKQSKQSPRYENGKFYWYKFDTFAIELTINLKRLEDGSDIITNPNDEIEITFFKQNIPIHKFKYTNFQNGSKFLLNFDAPISKKFTPGIYEYTITYSGSNRTTIISKNSVEVE